MIAEMTLFSWETIARRTFMMAKGIARQPSTAEWSTKR